LVGIPFHCLARHTLPLTSQRTASRPSLRRAALSSGDTSEPATPPIAIELRHPPVPLPASCWHAVPSLAGELRRPYLPLSVGRRDALPFPSSTGGLSAVG
jgi:hypothetical protein